MRINWFEIALFSLIGLLGLLGAVYLLVDHIDPRQPKMTLIVEKEVFCEPIFAYTRRNPND